MNKDKINELKEIINNNYKNEIYSLTIYKYNDMTNDCLNVIFRINNKQNIDIYSLFNIIKKYYNIKKAYVTDFDNENYTNSQKFKSYLAIKIMYDSEIKI